MPVLRRRAAAWCLDNGMPEAALEYFMAAGDVDEAARLVGRLLPSVYRQGRDGHHPAVAWMAGGPRRDRETPDDRGAGLVHVRSDGQAGGRRAVGRSGRAVQVRGPGAGPRTLPPRRGASWSSAPPCARRGAEQMRADTDEAVRLLPAGSLLTPTPALLQGIARILCGDLDGGDLSLQDAVSIGEQVDSPVAVAAALGERSLIAMARGEWDRAEALAGQAGTVLRQAGVEESFATPLVCALRARMALHRGDAQAARRELVQCPAPAAVADLRASPPRRPGPDRAGPRPPRTRRPRRCPHAHAGGR